MTIPHFAYPFRISGGSAVVVEQDTHEEVAQCVQILLSTPAGSRIEAPTYGIPDPVFGVQSKAREQAMTDAVNFWEPRAQAIVTVTVDNVDSLVHHIRAQIADRPESMLPSVLPQPRVIEEESGDAPSFGGGGFGKGGFGE